MSGDLYDEEGRQPVHEEESTADWSDMSFMRSEGIVERRRGHSHSATFFQEDSILRIEGNSVDRAHSVQSSNSGRSHSTAV